MKLKLDADGHAVVQDGKPVYVHDDGKEVAFDAPATTATVNRLFGENKSYRERAESAETKAKAFDGLDDPIAARKALETVKNLDDKKLVDAGEVDKVKQEVSKGYETKLTEAEAARVALENLLYSEKIGGSFARSAFITEKLAIPADLVQARFGQAFKVEEGKIVAYDSNGQKLYSRSNPGDLANFDEALEFLIDQYPQKDSIVKGTTNSGGGSTQHNPNGPKPAAGNLGGNRTERTAAIAARFPELSKG